MTEDETVSQDHRLHGRESEQTPGDSEGQGILMFCKNMGSQKVGHD